MQAEDQLLEAALRVPRVLSSILPAMDILAQAPNTRGLLQSQELVRAVLPGLRTMEAHDKPPEPEVLQMPRYEEMKSMSAEQFQQTPRQHRVLYYDERLRERLKELAKFRMIRQAREFNPKLTFEEAERHVDPRRPFVPPRSTNPDGREGGPAWMTLQGHERELLDSSPLRAQSHIQLDVLEREVKKV